MSPAPHWGAFGLYNYGIRIISVSRASICIKLIPVIAIILGWIFLEEALNLKQGIAVGIVIFGEVLSNHNSSNLKFFSFGIGFFKSVMVI